MEEIKQLGNCMVTGKRENPNQGRVYDSDGIAPSLNTMGGGNREPMITEIEVFGNYMPSGYDASRVVNTAKLAPTVRENHGTVTAIVDVKCAALRGRDKQNPNYRGPANDNFEQTLEVREDELTNTITTVQKDNMVLIKQATKAGYIPCEVGGGVRLGISNIKESQRKSNRERNDKSDSDNGECP